MRLVGIALLSLLATVAHGQTPLRWRLEPGEILEWNAEQTVHSVRNVGGPANATPLKTSISMQLRWRWEVLTPQRSDREAMFDIQQTLVAFQLSMNAGDGKPLEYDSEKPTEPLPPLTKQLVGPLSAWLDEPQALRLSQRGDIQPRAQQGQEPPKQQAADGEPSGLPPSPILAMAQGVLPPLPPRPVDWKSRWQDQRQESTAAGAVTVRRTFRIHPASSTQGGRVQIGMTGALALQPVPHAAGEAPFQLQRQSLTGRYSFDVARGRLHDARLKQVFTTRRPLSSPSSGVELTTTTSELTATCKVVQP